jgi:protein-tyrosine-phosphatase
MIAAPLPGSVLFACGMNSVRSPMAEALLKSLHGSRIYVDSVGVRSRPVDPFVIEVMKELGIDVGRHRPKTFDTLADTSFDVVIAMSPEAQHKAIEMTRTMACEVEYWPTFNPTIVEGRRDQTLQAFRDVRDQLLKRIRARFPVSPVPDL